MTICRKVAKVGRNLSLPFIVSLMVNCVLSLFRMALFVCLKIRNFSPRLQSI
jgi:hypothetical protein